MAKNITKYVSRLIKIAGVLSLCVLVLAGNAFSQDENVDKDLKKGIYHFRQEDYDEALDVFEGVIEKDPKSSLANYYLGLTYKRLEDYVEAKQYLEASLTMKPKIKGALIELIDLLYRLDDYDEAKKWIKVAEDEGVRPAQAKFLKGLTLQKNSEYAEAVIAFEEAKDLDDRLAQSANYQIGVCHVKLKHYDKARDIFEETFALDPYSDLAESADRYIDALSERIDRDRPFHFSARTAFEYDSNVTLKPTDTSLVTGVTDQDDTRQVYDVKADYTFKSEDKKFSLKTGYGLHVSKQNDIGLYDLIGNYFSAQANVTLDKILLTFPVNYNYTSVNNKNYLSGITAGNITNFVIGKKQMAQLGILYNHDQYLQKPALISENRTGNELTGIAGWFWFFKGNKGFLNLRYAFNKDWAKGNNWEYIG